MRQPLGSGSSLPADPVASPDLSSIEAMARADLEGAYRARETALADCRRIIRCSANAIRAVHREEWSRAEGLMEEAGETLAAVQAALAPYPEVLHAGFVADAAKEYAEARLTAAMARGADLPDHRALGLDVAPFLNGLGEAVGELRRRMLDRLRAGEVAEAEEVLVAMDTIVDLLADLDFPDGMTGGLRRTTDVARALVERSRADLTATVVQERLRVELEQRLGNPPDQGGQPR
jgi:translin